MNRNEAIERAVRKLFTQKLGGYGVSAQAWIDLSVALAMPKADAERSLIFWSGPKYSFYTESLEMGEQIVKHLPNSDDFTATALSPQAEAERVALLERIDKESLYLPEDTLTATLLRDIRAYLTGGES